MKTFVTFALIFAVASAIPSKDVWKPAGPIDISKYIPLDITTRALHPFPNNKMARRPPTTFIPRNEKSFADICGMENKPKDRIIGGQEANPNQFPWIVALFIDNAYFCGGALISDEYVLTAAHCADGASVVKILAGAHNIRDPNEDGRIEITSRDMTVHPDWDTANLSNDLALIKLPEKITFNDIIKPSCLPTNDDVDNDFEGELVMAMGWGLPTENAGGISAVLKYADGLEVISNEDCAMIFGDIINDGHICLSTEGGEGSCNGDSGGPLNYKTGKNKYMQIGLVSFGSSAGCAIGYPTSYTRITQFLDWISSETGVVVSH